MSTDLTDATRRTRVLGSISGWDRITTDEAEDNAHIPSNDHEYTLPDLYLQLKELINQVDPSKIEYLIKLISEHINDKDNPHKTTLDKMGTSVIKELYHLWLEKGYLGSEETFIKQLFQYVKIADLDTTREGQVIDQIPSVYSAATILKDHNESIDVHANLLEAMFPGTDLQGPPTYALLGNVGIDAPEVTISRSGIQYVVNSFGVLEKVEENQLKPDWSYGEPGYPIFGGYSNLLYYSENLDISGYFTYNSNLIVYDSSSYPNIPVYPIRPDSDGKLYYLQEDSSVDQQHYLHTYSNFDPGIYTFSCFVYPVNRAACGLRFGSDRGVPMSLDTESRAMDYDYTNIGFDFETLSVFINDRADKEKLSGNIVRLPSGWYRVWMTIKVDETDEGWHTLEMFPLDIYDGDIAYDGNGSSGMFITGVQLSNTSTITPYIYTNGKRVSCGNTNVSIKVDKKWFNTNQSTIVASVSNIPPLANTTGQQQYVYKVSGLDSNAVTKVTALARYHTGAEQKPYFVIYNNKQQTRSVTGATNTNYKSIFVQSYSNQDKSVCFGYLNGDPVESTLIYPINEIVDTIYLGSDANTGHYLNGYLFEFIYYPFKSNAEQIKFFFGD